MAHRGVEIQVIASSHTSMNTQSAIRDNAKLELLHDMVYSDIKCFRSHMAHRGVKYKS